MLDFAGRYRPHFGKTFPFNWLTNFGYFLLIESTTNFARPL
jgi:hypothetical protein